MDNLSSDLLRVILEFVAGSSIQWTQLDNTTPGAEWHILSQVKQSWHLQHFVSRVESKSQRTQWTSYKRLVKLRLWWSARITELVLPAKLKHLATMQLDDVGRILSHESVLKFRCDYFQGRSLTLSWRTLRSVTIWGGDLERIDLSATQIETFRLAFAKSCQSFSIPSTLTKLVVLHSRNVVIHEDNKLLQLQKLELGNCPLSRLLSCSMPLLSSLYLLPHRGQNGGCLCCSIRSDMPYVLELWSRNLQSLQRLRFDWYRGCLASSHLRLLTRLSSLEELVLMQDQTYDCRRHRFIVDELGFLASLPLRKLELHNFAALRSLPFLRKLVSLRMTWCGDPEEAHEEPSSVMLGACQATFHEVSAALLKNVREVWG